MKKLLIPIFGFLLLLAGNFAVALKPPPGAGQLPPAKGVLDWAVLKDVKIDTSSMMMKATFGSKIKAMSGKPVVMQGFMMPMDQGRAQKKFLLSALAPDCPFCLAGGPESMVEVRAPSGINITFSPIKVKGTFKIVTNMNEGIFYKLENASLVK